MATVNVTASRRHRALGRVDERSHHQHRTGSGHQGLSLKVPEQHRRLPEVATLGLAEQERGVPGRHDSCRYAEPRHRLDESVSPDDVREEPHADDGPEGEQNDRTRERATTSSSVW